MDSWLETTRALIASDVPDLRVEGRWRRVYSGGTEESGFRAVHAQATWSVEGDDGRRLLADSQGEVVLEEGAWEVRAGGYGWRRAQPAGVLLRPGSWFPDLASAQVLDGPAESVVADRLAHRYVIRVSRDSRDPLTLWLDSELPLVLRAQAGDGRESMATDSPFRAEITCLAEADPSDCEQVRRDRELMLAVREERMAEGRGEVVDQSHAQQLADLVVAAFGPGTRSEEIMASGADGHFLLRLDVDGEPVIVTRHRPERRYQSILGRLERAGQGSWEFTIDYRGELEEERLVRVLGTMCRSTALTQ